MLGCARVVGSAFIAALATMAQGQIDLIHFESFEDPPGSTYDLTNHYELAPDAFFGRFRPDAEPFNPLRNEITGIHGGNAVYGLDLDGPAPAGPSPQQVIIIPGIDINGVSQLDLVIALGALDDEPAQNQYENALSVGGPNMNGVTILGSIDGQPPQVIAAFRGSGGDAPGANPNAGDLYLDQNLDGIGDFNGGAGLHLTRQMQDFAFPIFGVGVTLDLFVEIESNDPGETIVVDHVRVMGDVSFLPQGACCTALIGGVFTNPLTCNAIGGSYLGDGTDPVVDCVQPLGPCCLPDGICQFLDEETCDLLGGLFGGIHSDCVSLNCQPFLPTNDDPSVASLLADVPATRTSDTTLASATGLDNPDGSPNLGRDLFYVFDGTGEDFFAEICEGAETPGSGGSEHRLDYSIVGQPGPPPAPQVVCVNAAGNPTGIVFPTAPGAQYLIRVSGNDALSAGVFELNVTSVAQYLQCISETDGEPGLNMFDALLYLTRRDIPSTAAELVSPSNVVNDDDTLAYIQIAEGDHASPDCPPTLDAPELRLSAEIISGAAMIPAAAEDDFHTGYGYDGVSVEMRVVSAFDPTPLGPFTLEALRFDGITLTTLLSAPLVFTGNESQIVEIPAAAFDENVEVRVVGPEVDRRIFRYHIEAGLVTRIVAVSEFDVADQIIGINVTPAEITATLTPGPNGSIVDPLDEFVEGETADDPFSGTPEEIDVLWVQCFDAMGRPAGNQEIDFQTSTPDVLFEVKTSNGKQRVQFRRGMTDSQGFTHMLVDYGEGEGEAKAKIEGKGAAKDDAPASNVKTEFDEEIEWIRGQRKQGPRVRGIDIVSCGAGADEKPVNRGLESAGSVLTYGTKYKLRARTGAIPAGFCLRWRIDGVAGVIDDPDKEICITLNDPNPSENSRASLTLKVTMIEKPGAGDPPGTPPKATRPSAEYTLTVVDKKTLTICPIAFGGETVDWANLIKGVNTIFTGTGVCFTSGTVCPVTQEANIRFSGGNSDTPGKAKYLKAEGTLDDYLQNNANSGKRGQPNKIVTYTGVMISQKDGNKWVHNVHGAALGSPDVLDAARVEALYDVNGIYQNTVVIDNGKLAQTVDDNGTPLAGSRTMAHELGHILGLSHRSNSGKLMTQGSSGQLINDTEALKLWNEACDLAP